MAEIIFPEIEIDNVEREVKIAFTESILGLNPDANPDGINYAFDTIARRYNEEHRRHHNLVHINEMIGMTKQLEDIILEPEVVTLATIGHDLYYDTTNQNEENEKSSALYSTVIYHQLGVGWEKLEKISHYILTTADHSTADLDKDLLLFLDMDMAILGASEERYARYVKAIRQEYYWADEATWRNPRFGRLAFLKSLKGRQVFQTAEFAHFEAQAKLNMQKEVEWLKSNPLL